MVSESGSNKEPKLMKREFGINQTKSGDDNKPEDQYLDLVKGTFNKSSPIKLEAVHMKNGGMYDCLQHKVMKASG